jgi:hypothetical protein
MILKKSSENEALVTKNNLLICILQKQKRNTEMSNFKISLDQ